MRWCSTECTDIWMAADPKRSEGWVSFSDMTPEQINEEFLAVGLALAGVGHRNPS